MGAVGNIKFQEAMLVIISMKDLNWVARVKGI
jgi:hypothetical protein